jgi:hypothetical protein
VEARERAQGRTVSKRESQSEAETAREAQTAAKCGRHVGMLGGRLTWGDVSLLRGGVRRLARARWGRRRAKSVPVSRLALVKNYLLYWYKSTNTD